MKKLYRRLGLALFDDFRSNRVEGGWTALSGMYLSTPLQAGYKKPYINTLITFVRLLLGRLMGRLKM